MRDDDLFRFIHGKRLIGARIDGEVITQIVLEDGTILTGGIAVDPEKYHLDTSTER